MELHFGRCEKTIYAFISIDTDPFPALSHHGSKLSASASVWAVWTELKSEDAAQIIQMQIWIFKIW